MAIAGALLTHVPKGDGSAKVITPPMQSEPGPEIVSGIAFTVTANTVKQPPG